MTVGRAQPGTPQIVGWVLVDDHTVSRVQAELRWHEPTLSYTIINRSDTNPTRVNGQVVSQVAIKPGDQIQVGLCTLVLEPDDTPAATPPEIPSRTRARDSKHSLPLNSGELPTAGVPRPVPPPKAPTPPSNPAGPRLPAPSGGHRVPKKEVVQPRPIGPSPLPPYYLQVMSGPDAGQRHDILALQVVLGSASPDVATAGATSEQKVLLSDPQIPTRALALSWRVLLEAFEVTRPGGNRLPVAVQRNVDGMQWNALLSLHEPGLLRRGDLFKLGGNIIRLSLMSNSDLTDK